MRKIFLDCGGHIGESIKRFKKSEDYAIDFEMYSFEPVPHLARHYRDWKDIIYSNKAIWIYDGEIEFYIDTTHNKASGSTLKKEKKSGKLDLNKPTKYPCIDFSSWVLDNFSKDDFIVLKMDIEGAEYDVLPKMIADGSIHLIDKAYVEFHWDKLGYPKETHDALVDSLESIEGFLLLPEMHTYIK